MNQLIGLGLKRELINDLLHLSLAQQKLGLPQFVEVAPENWIGQGYKAEQTLMQIAERYPLISHGLSLSIGGIKPLNIEFIKQVKQFLQQFNVQLYSEHLSYSDDGGYLYDLLPLPMTQQAVNYVSERILQVQDILGQRLVIENVSTYVTPNSEMSEAQFIAEVIKQADCELLLDVNNVYVNYTNHKQTNTAKDFIQQMPTDKIRYLHVAGHLHYTPPQAHFKKQKNNKDDLSPFLIDTHGEDVCTDVWNLLAYTYQTHGVKPTLLERDFNIPPLKTLQKELKHIKKLQAPYLNKGVTA